MHPVSHEAGWGFNGGLEPFGNYGGTYSHKGGFGSGFAGWGNPSTGDMLQSDQDIGEGDFEPHHPPIVEQGRGNFNHNSHNHGIGYGYNKGEKSKVPETAPKDVLKNINEAINEEVSSINVEAARIKEIAEARMEKFQNNHKENQQQADDDDNNNKHEASLVETSSQELKVNEDEPVATLPDIDTESKSSKVFDSTSTKFHENNSKHVDKETKLLENKKLINMEPSPKVKAEKKKEITSKKLFDNASKTALTRAINEKPVNERRTI